MCRSYNAHSAVDALSDSAHILLGADFVTNDNIWRHTSERLLHCLSLGVTVKDIAHSYVVLRNARSYRGKLPSFINQ